MTPLLDTNQAQWELAPAEFGVGVRIGQLLSPGTRFRDYGELYGVDNFAYAGFKPAPFLSLLRRQESSRDRCKFVAVPDVVCDARRTLEVFHIWKNQLCGWPLALVIQNGQEQLPIPWPEIKAVFIGGDDAFKDGPHAAAIAKAAIALGKWVHVGRVNGATRLRHWVGVVGDYADSSFDGSGASQYSHMRIDLGRVLRGEEDSPLFQQEDAA